MEKNKEDGMTDLEIVKECLITLNREAPFCAKMIEGTEAATRMAAEIERLKAALAEKPDVVKCGECKHLNYKKDVCILTGLYNSDDTFSCSYGRREEAKR